MNHQCCPPASAGAAPSLIQLRAQSPTPKSPKAQGHGYICNLTSQTYRTTECQSPLKLAATASIHITDVETEAQKDGNWPQVR